MVFFKEMESKAVAIIYVGEMTTGFISGWASPAISKLQSSNETPLSATIDDGQASLLGATILVGVILGAPFSGILSNVIGRRYCLIIGGLICTVSFLLLAVFTELWMLMLGRTLLGVGVGPVYILNLTYITEVSSKNNRGVFLTGTVTASAMGLVFVYSIGPYISYSAMNYVGLLISATFTAGLLYIPETPAFNVMKGNEIKAKKTLLQLGRCEEIEDVLSVTTSTKKHSCSSLTAIVSTRSNRKGFNIAAVLLVLQQLSGHICVILFGTSIFKSTGSTITPALATIGMGLSELVGSCVSPVIARKVGRKAIMLVSTAICCLSLGTLGCFFFVKSIQPQLAEEVYWLPLLSLVIYLLSYTTGLGIIPNTWMSEMLDSNARGPGSAVALSISWIFCFITTSSFGYMTTILGHHWTFCIYAVACAIAFVFTAVVVPETRGKTLTEIQHMLSNEIKAKKTLLQLGRCEEIEDVLSVTTSTKKHSCSSLTAIVSTRSNRKGFNIAAVLLVLQQLSGHICVILFGTSIFKSTGSTITPALATIGMGLSELVGSCVSPVIARKVGRKAIMLVSTAICCLSLGTLGCFFFVKSIQPQLAEEVYWLPLLSLVIYLLSYTTGLGIIPNTWMSEMLDSNARGPGSAVALSISWIFCFITTSSFGYMTTILGHHWTFCIYAVACAIAFVFTAVVVPETRGKTLTEIQHMLSN